VGVKYQALKGMEDLLPGEIEKWQWLENKARIFFESYGFNEIRTPVLESTELFTRSIGEGSDIVHKEMFSFKDRGDRKISLRPEMTASVARAVIEHGLLKTNKSLRLYYMGPMFRAERPQAGRKRQFHQIGIEIVNEVEFLSDFDCVSLLYRFLVKVGVENFTLKVNDLGDSATQRKRADQLQVYFKNKKSELCPDCHYRLEKNVLRIFDCKKDSCQPVIDSAPWEESAPVSQEFQKLTELLTTQSIPYVIERRLVRGLDYYNGVVFEVTAKGLGAQDAIAGGGRYDRLYSDLGGAPTPCTGFSIGVERLIAALEKAQIPLSERKRIREKLIYVAPLLELEEIYPPTPNRKEKTLTPFERVNDAIFKLGESGFRAVLKEYSTKLSDHLKIANKMHAKYVVILGPDEISKKIWKIKNMDTQEQIDVPFDDLISHFKGIAI